MVAKLSFILKWITLFSNHFTTNSNFMYNLFKSDSWNTYFKTVVNIKVREWLTPQLRKKRKKEKKVYHVVTRRWKLTTAFESRQTVAHLLFTTTLWEGLPSTHVVEGAGPSTHFSNHERAWLSDARHRQTFKAHHERPTDGSSLLESTFKLG